MSANSLKLNHDKSEFMLFGSKAQLAKINVPSISINNSCIHASKSTRNLGIILDCTMSMSNHVSNTCKSVRYQLRNLGMIRKYLTRSTTEKIVHALISSRLDFCNSLMYNLSQTEVSRLQRLQNTAARIVTLSKKFNHKTPVLKLLHWLPVKFRSIFKTLLLVFHCLHGSAPEYNSILFKRYNPRRQLRSSDSSLLVVPKTRTLWGDRSFAHAGSILWNQLPQPLKDVSTVNSFKTSLKTYLFQEAFG